jgi:prepilin-type N-terminal cleavage/methylation domain-containing protein
MRKNSEQGMTLVELMITVAIIAIVLSIAVITMSGYIPKQHLISTQSQLADLFQRAQTEANSKSTWTCVIFGNTFAQAYVDADDTHGTNTPPATTCGPGPPDTLITSLNFKGSVSLAQQSDSNCSNNVGTGCVIWFDTTGSPKLCTQTGTLCGNASSSATPGSGCIDWSYQIVLSNSQLQAGNRAREVEVYQGGMVQIVKPSDKGGITAYTLFANSPDNPGGCE